MVISLRLLNIAGIVPLQFVFLKVKSRKHAEAAELRWDRPARYCQEFQSRDAAAAVRAYPKPLAYWIFA